MDYNGLLAMESMLGMYEFPIAFRQAVERDGRLAEGYNNLSESAKEELIMRYKDAKTAEERNEILQVLIPSEDSARAVYRDDMK